MRFDRVGIVEAQGVVLAHTLRLPGGVLKKGRVLSDQDLRNLEEAGYESVIAARLERNDVGEDDAAGRVAAASLGDEVRIAEAFTGRCNIYAETRGLLVIDKGRVDALNRIHESITIATLNPYELVEAQDMIATVKVIPFAVPLDVVDACVAVGQSDSALLRVAPLRTCSAGLILTELPGIHPKIIQRASDSVHTRLSRLGSEVMGEIYCSHEEKAVCNAIEELLSAGCSPILMLGASAIVDRRDILPGAVISIGGEIDHLGMPVDPGNLLLLAHRGETPIVGVPGCARSLKPSGFDWVLNRLVAGVPIDGHDLMGMGVGGLLKETPNRPKPREQITEELDVSPSSVAAVVLAAGSSRRMGQTNKLLCKVEGRAMVTSVVDATLDSNARPVVVVTGHEAEQVRMALEGREVEFVHNPDYDEGMSTSLRVGVAALNQKVDGALICLADMPWLKGIHIDMLIEAFDPRDDQGIYVPVHDRKRGNPVLWHKRFFEEIARLQGDQGARTLLDDHPDEVRHVPVSDAAVNIDIDTPDALQRWRKNSLS